MKQSFPGIAKISKSAALYHLEILGISSTSVDEPVPFGTENIALLGPQEPGFWEYVIGQPEFLDKAPDPLDRWSMRIVTLLAKQIGGTAIYPFDGPPYAPFISWALKSENVWASPVSLLVHSTSGLFVSFRGAIALPYKVKAASTPEKPCNTCATKPCISACPVNALSQSGYDQVACHGYLDTPAGQDCLDSGCAARRACPVSQTYGRLSEQSAYHMKAFHP